MPSTQKIVEGVIRKMVKIVGRCGCLKWVKTDKCRRLLRKTPKNTRFLWLISFIWASTNLKSYFRSHTMVACESMEKISLKHSSVTFVGNDQDDNDNDSFICRHITPYIYNIVKLFHENRKFNWMSNPLLLTFHKKSRVLGRRYNWNINIWC